MRTTPRIQFCDPSVAVAALVPAAQLLADLNHFGYMFEALVVRDLRVSPRRGRHGAALRDSESLEVDAVVTAGDGRWAAFEVRLGQPDSIRPLPTCSLRPQSRHLEGRRPSGAGRRHRERSGYTRPDGVVVIPAATLGP